MAKRDDYISTGTRGENRGHSSREEYEQRKERREERKYRHQEIVDAREERAARTRAWKASRKPAVSKKWIRGKVRTKVKPTERRMNRLYG